MYQGVLDTTRVIALLIVMMVLIIAFTDSLSGRNLDRSSVHHSTFNDKSTYMINVRNFNFSNVNKSLVPTEQYCSVETDTVCNF